MIKNILVSVLISAASFSVLTLGSVAEARLPMPGPITLNVDGIRAEYLFSLMSGFDSVAGLEGIADCAMGTCQTEMKRVTCTKSVASDSESLSCSVLTMMPGAREVQVSSRDVPAVSALRRALVEIAGREVTRGSAKTISVKSVKCEGKRLGRELDELSVETTFSCAVTR